MPGDKSISHRALMLASLARDSSTVSNLAPGLDVASTARCLRQLGVRIHRRGDRATIGGNPGRFPQVFDEPDGILDCGNSGTTMRLLLGLLAGQELFSVLSGDASLRRRPMGRLTEPLSRMGARLNGRQGARLPPLALQGRPLEGRCHLPSISSAQVKSALLLAGLTAEGETRVIQPEASRDHTERMLQFMGAEVNLRGPADVAVVGLKAPLEPLRMSVPGDISSAAFVMAGALLVPGSRITLRGVGLNPGRTGILEVLREAGARLEVRSREDQAGEPAGDITVEHSDLSGFQIGPGQVPSLIDEIPVLALLAAQSRGRTEIRGAEELRVKESDRLAEVARGLSALGAQVRELPDGLIIQGVSRFQNPEALTAGGDHRLALTWALASLVVPGPMEVSGAGVGAVSYPSFFSDMEALAGVTGQ